MSDRLEFWSSVEYGTFLKGLVRELCGASAAKEEGGLRKSRGGESGTQELRNGEQIADGGWTMADGDRSRRPEEGRGQRAESDGRNDQGPMTNDQCGSGKDEVWHGARHLSLFTAQKAGDVSRGQLGEG